MTLSLAPAAEPRTSATDRAPAPQRRRTRGRSLLISFAFLAVAVIALVPLWAIFVATFRDGNDVIQHGLSLGADPSSLSFNSYVALFTDSGMYFPWFVNSLLVLALQVVLTLLVSAFVAYGFAMYEFRFKTTLFVLVLVILTVPFEMLMLPLYVEVNDLGLTDSYVAVVLPFLAHASTIFFFRQYLRGIPREIVESGRCDGVSEFGIFFRLVLPLMKPAVAAMAILNGMASWNNFLWPLLVLRDAAKYTLPIGLNTLLTPYGNNYELLIVGSLFSLVPVLVLFLLFQKYFVNGITAGAVKG